MINLYITNKHIDKLNLYQSILNWLSIAFNNWQYFCDKLSWWPHAFVHFLINHQIIITSFEFYPLQILKEQNTCHKTLSTAEGYGTSNAIPLKTNINKSGLSHTCILPIKLSSLHHKIMNSYSLNLIVLHQTIFSYTFTKYWITCFL